MRTWLKIADGIDRINTRVGANVKWLILAMTVVSALNAVSRKAFSLSSNAFLEAQWYLFAAVFLLAAGYTLQRNAHVRIDLVSSRLSVRTRLWVELAATCLFLFPFAVMVTISSASFFADSVANREISLNAGGLVVWPVKLLIPVGFGLLILQGVGQVIKTAAALRGALPADAVFATPGEAATPADASRQ